MQAAVFYLFQYVSPQHLSCWVYQLWLADLSLRVTVTDRSTHRGLTFIIIQAPCRKSWMIVYSCAALGDTNDNKTAVGPEDVSKMGCPCLGEHTRLEVVIEESYEFKVTQNQQLRNSEPPDACLFWNFLPADMDWLYNINLEKCSNFTDVTVFWVNIYFTFDVW